MSIMIVRCMRAVDIIADDRCKLRHLRIQAAQFKRRSYLACV